MNAIYKKRAATKKSRKVKDTRGSYSVKREAKTQVVIEAVYDGKVFLPERPPLLKANTRVRITVETVKPRRAGKKSFIETAESIEIEAPSDFSSNLDAYLYRGKPFHD